MNSVENLTPGHVTPDAFRPNLPAEGVLIMDACPVTALGMKRVLTGSCGITKSVNYVQRLAGIPAAIARSLPALLIMDICGEKESVLDGLRLLAHLQDSHPEMKIIICTDFSDHRVLELLASSPANGVLLKHEPELALVQCVFDVMAWTLFRAPDFHSALNMYAGQIGLHNFALGDALAVTLRSAHGLAALLGIACILAPAFKSWYEQRFGSSALYAPIAAVWPVAGFLLSFALIASREAVPFLYFQF